MVKLNALILVPRIFTNIFGKQSTCRSPLLSSQVQPQFMKTTSTLLFFLVPLFSWTQIATTLTSYDFEAVSNNRLLIRFTVPEDPPDYSYNIHSAYIYSANSSKIMLATYNGDSHNLQSGLKHQIIWDVLKDADELDAPERVEIHLSYTKATQRKHLEVRRNEEAEQLKKEKMDQEQQVVESRKAKHNYYPGLTLGAAVSAGYVRALFKEMNENIEYDFGLGYGLSAFMEINLGGSTYLQLEGAYTGRRFYFNHVGLSLYPNGCLYAFNTQQAHFTFTDYRIYGKLKFGVFQIGGYYSFLQSAKRGGDMEYTGDCDNGFIDIVSEDNFQYNLLDNEHYPADRNEVRATQGDYGLTLGLETPARNNLVLGIGVDLSISNLINNKYELWTDQNARDLFPPQTAELRLGYAYFKIGVRL